MNQPVQMGGEPLVPDPNNPPPKLDLPRTKSFGLADIEPYMQEGAWEVFITVVAWAVHWQNITDKKVPAVDVSHLGLIMSPFVGMGNPNIWPIYQSVISTLVLDKALRWFEEGEDYQKQHSLVWEIVDTVAPVLAQLSKGWNARQAVKVVLADRSKLEVPFR